MGTISKIECLTISGARLAAAFCQPREKPESRASGFRGGEA